MATGGLRLTGERPPANHPAPEDSTGALTLSLSDEARSHLDRGRAIVHARVVRRARGWALVRGMLTTGALLLLLPPLAPRFGIDLMLLQAIGLFVGSSVFFASMRGEKRRFRRRIDENWERSILESATATTDRKCGLIVSAASLLESRANCDHGFSAAMLERFLSLPLPTPARLQILLPGASPRLMGGTLAILLLVFALGPSLTRLSSLWGEEGSVPSPATASRTSESSQVDRTASSEEPIDMNHRLLDEVARLRTELSQREDLARRLEGVPELAPLVEVLRSGGLIPELGPLPKLARERLQRAIGDSRRRGVSPAMTEALESLLRVGDSPSPPTNESLPFRWEDSARRLSEIARGWERGEGTAGTAELLVPEWADGGTTSSPTTVAPQPIGDSEIAPPTDSDPLTLSEGLPIARGDRVDSVPQISRQATSIDRTETWLRRPELEPSWFPVIEAYRRLRSDAVPPQPQPPRNER